MGLSLLPIQDQITAKLNELPQAVYDNGIPDDTMLEYNNGVMLPFMVPYYGGFSRSLDARGIVSSRQDLGESYVIVDCVGPTERSARQVADLVMDKLTGFVPVDAGELRPTGGLSKTIRIDNPSKPTKYVFEVSFRYAVNTNVVS